MSEEDKYSVLYVDDEENNLIVFKSAFRRNYNIYTALSAEAAQEILRENSVAVIITDQRMPVTTGVEFLQGLPDQPENIRMILSGYTDVQAVIDAINKGKVYRFINKPWDREELMAIIDDAICAYKQKNQVRETMNRLLLENEALRQQLAAYS
jgi:response regulator RpfG family c-di-GMP phosphodiesterase